MTTTDPVEELLYCLYTLTQEIYVLVQRWLWNVAKANDSQIMRKCATSKYVTYYTVNNNMNMPDETTTAVS